ncbi:MAG: hypothetical protein G01um101456_402 [Parcubacteria group bacterium Gr01-1014_56]|nr:MAG: hypothetical protein G01um101456_402 [Parcubacteria group bacterium Gr01-1014_56]
MSEKKGSPHLIKHAVTYLGAVGIGIGGMFVLAYFALPAIMSVSYTKPTSVASPLDAASSTPKKPVVLHIPTPSVVKAIYLSQCVVGTPSFRNSLIKFIEDTELNSVVIDIRDYTGKISFPTDNPALKDAVSKACGAADMDSFIKTLHEKGIYVIGRITTFQNPYWSSLYPEHAVQKEGGGVWKDFKGLSFVDVGATLYWDNVVELGKVSYAIGFDELNFDYLRYPSDGPMADVVYSFDEGKSKPQVLEEFYKYLTDNLRPTGAVLSADLFGMTATNEDDLNIGQVLERALPYFDYISPMVYPSHYPSGFHGYVDVNEHPYDIVKFSMDTAVKRTLATTTKIASLAFRPIASTSPQMFEKPIYSKAKIRPWLQSFDYPVVYTPAMVEAQIKANQDAGLDSWMFWDAANKYNALRKVLAATSTVQ